MGFPKLENLSLISNRLNTLEALKPLAASPALRRLYLLNNPVTALPNYRVYVAAALPHLTVLDFQKVTQKEREEGLRLFRDWLHPGGDATGLMDTREKLRLLIEKSTSLEELRRLEVLLRMGEVSEDILDQRLREMGLL